MPININPEDDNMLEDPENDRKMRKTLSSKGTDLKT
jgi:hypothetical protein